MTIDVEIALFINANKTNQTFSQFWTTIRLLFPRLVTLVHCYSLVLESTLIYTFFSPYCIFRFVLLLRSLDFRPIRCTCVRLSNVLIFLSFVALFLSLSLTSISRMSLSNVAISLRFLVWTWMSFLV